MDVEKSTGEMGVFSKSVRLKICRIVQGLIWRRSFLRTMAMRK
jgi:hypothetical protein